MKLTSKLAAVAVSAGLAVAGLMVTAPPAAAVGGCDANQLCLYRSTEFRTMAFETTKTNECWWLGTYGLTDPWNGISSYVNNLPVNATLYTNVNDAPVGQPLWANTGGIPRGSFSSNSTSNYWFGHSDYICTGSATP
ncbi:peptidase inhibitor family I36 protein [Streptomyces sp. NBC_01546]|uniref:peptidase inhibitor family I36 protein n=1 Tax=Streptomyces sp. NBC_01546 TaxID=2975872 RepID=UPI00386D60AA